MNTIIRGEKAWERLATLPKETEDWFISRGTVEGLPDKTLDFLDELASHPKGRLTRIVAAMHDRIIRERGTLPEMMLMLDVYPWRHQIAFVWNERYRGKQRQRGVRWWLHTILAMNVEDVQLPEEPPVIGGGEVDLSFFASETDEEKAGS